MVGESGLVVLDTTDASEAGCTVFKLVAVEYSDAAFDDPNIGAP